MDLNFIVQHIPQYIDAAFLTLKLAAIGIFLSLLLGLLCSLFIYFKIPVVRQLCSLYIELLYFGLPKIGVFISSEACAIIGLTFLGGSYMAEAFRSGLNAVETSQIESGLSIGLTRLQLIRYVILPQAFATSIPPLCANFIFLIKETSVFSAVALADLMYVAKDLIGLYYKTDEALLMLVIAYLIILLPISLLASFVERQVRYAGFGN